MVKLIIICIYFKNLESTIEITGYYWIAGKWSSQWTPTFRPLTTIIAVLFAIYGKVDCLSLPIKTCSLPSTFSAITGLLLGDHRPPRFVDKFH